MQAGGRGFESLYFHHQQHAASCGCLWACIVLLLIRSTVICAELLNYDHEDECLVRAAWTSDLHRASSSRKNAVPSGETGCGIGEAHTLVSLPLLTASTGREMGNRCSQHLANCKHKIETGKTTPRALCILPHFGRHAGKTGCVSKP